jgi:hypothetical protein
MMSVTPNAEFPKKGVADRLLAAAGRGLDRAGHVAGTARAPVTQRDHAVLSLPTLATVEDVVAAYKLLLRRPPDPNGLHLYREWVARGLTLDELIGSFTNSDEFRRRIVPMLPGELTATIRRQGLAEDVVTIDVGGYTVCVRASDADFGRAIVATRDYEPHVRRFLKGLLRAGQVVIEAPPDPADRVLPTMPARCGWRGAHRLRRAAPVLLFPASSHHRVRRRYRGRECAIAHGVLGGPERRACPQRDPAAGHAPVRRDRDDRRPRGRRIGRRRGLEPGSQRRSRSPGGAAPSRPPFGGRADPLPHQLTLDAHFEDNPAP